MRSVVVEASAMAAVHHSRSTLRCLGIVGVVALAGCGPGAGPVPWPSTGGGSGGADLQEAGFGHTPDQLILGQRATMHVTVRNAGAEAAGAFDVEFAVIPSGHRLAWPRGHVAG